MSISDKERARRATPEHKARAKAYALANKDRILEQSAARRRANRAAYRASRAKYDKGHRDIRKNNSSVFRKLRCEREPWYTAFRSAQVRCKKSGRDFSITLDYLASLWTGRCALTGMEFVTNTVPGPHAFSATLDRIDSRRGYVPGNVRFLLHCVNSFKNNMTDNELRVVAQALLAGLPAPDHTA